MEPLILGSSSLRRKEILSFFSLPFLSVSPDFAEESIAFQGDPKLHAATLAEEKGAILKERFPSQVILTADTLVFCEGKLYNKPSSREEAIHFLHTLSGKWHSVHTGVSVRKGDMLFTEVEETEVLFNHLSAAHILQYIKSIPFADKAGGYAIQGAGSLIVASIRGCYYNVMGLPVNTLARLLAKVQIDLWDFLL